MRYKNVRKRENLAELLGSLGFRVGAEVGVMRGEFSRVLLDKIHGLFLYCVDVWEDYPGYNVRASKGRQAEIYEQAKQNLQGCNVMLVKKTSLQAAATFEDGTLDFVYIDANHEFDFVMQDIIEWSRKVKKGGIVAGHDYFPFPAGDGGVVEAVDAYARAHHIKQVYLTDDRERSWFWFKE